jgi:thiamine pyrophosphate-dependent acetolactate synthase large subunit-like protein
MMWGMTGLVGFSMMMGDFITLTQMGLPVKVIVLNNGTLGFVEMEMKASGFLDTGCAYHFGMYMMKAVLDGRATQLIDLAKVNLSR